MPRFDERVFHHNFEDHQAAAGRRVVTEAEADEVWYGDRTFYPNRRTRGSYLMEGLTQGGRLITVVCRLTVDGTWELYTAW